MRLVLIVIAGIVAGGAAGAGVGFGLYPPWVGVVLAIVVGAVTGRTIWRAVRARRRGQEG